MNLVKPSEHNLKKCVEVLNRGGVVIYPTEAASALGGKFSNKKAVARIMKIKKRRDPKFTLVASSLFQVEKVFKLSTAQRSLAKKYWPGPLSIIVSSKYAVRVPNNKVARSLARRAGEPLLATSANLAGGRTPVTAKEIYKIFFRQKNQPDLILDAGKIKTKKPSTVVMVEGDEVKIIRPGEIIL